MANQDTDNIGIFHFSLSTGLVAVTHAEWCERFDSGLREFHHLRNLADNGKYKLTNLSSKTAPKTTKHQFARRSAQVDGQRVSRALAQLRLLRRARRPLLRRLKVGSREVGGDSTKPRDSHVLYHSTSVNVPEGIQFSNQFSV